MCHLTDDDLLTCDSGQAQAEEEEPRHGPEASHLPHDHLLTGLMAASDWSRASILASDWSAAGDNHSVSRHVTDSPGGMHFLLWQEYWVTKFTLCSHSLSPDSTMSFRGSFLLKDLSLLWSSWFGAKAALLQSEFSSLLFTELCRFTFLIHGTVRQFSLKGKGMKIVYKLKSFEFFDCFECSKHYN